MVLWVTVACCLTVLVAVGIPMSVSFDPATPTPPPPAPQARPAQAKVPSPTPPVAAPPTLNALFVGASITAGMTQSSLQDTFPALTVQKLENQGVDVQWQLRARSGATVEEALSWPYPTGQQVIVVHLVTNDFTDQTPLATYSVELQQLLTRLRQGSPKAALVCLGAWAKPGAQNADHTSVDAYDSADQSACLAQRGTFVPLDTIFATPGMRGPNGVATPWGPSDGFHPNDQGAATIADAVVEAIDEQRGLTAP